MLPTLIASQRLNFLFSMKFLEQQWIYVNNIYFKFKGQKINIKKDIYNLPTCVVLRNTCENHFTTANFDTLPRLINCLFTMKLLLYNLFYVDNMYEKFQGQKSLKKKDIQNLPTWVALRIHFSTANFDTLRRAEIFFIYHEIFVTRSSLC